MTRRLRSILLGTIIGLGLVGGYVAYGLVQDGGSGPLRHVATINTGAASIGGPFTLTDHNGQRVTDRSYDGKLRLIYFGFTFCPDVCPTELYLIGQTMDALGQDAAAVQPILVTVDPERDTPAVLKEYVSLFHPRLVGLTGTPEEIRAVERAYKVYAQKVPLEEGGYTMDHSSFTFLMGRDGDFITVFPYQTPVKEMVRQIEAALNTEAG